MLTSNYKTKNNTINDPNKPININNKVNINYQEPQSKSKDKKKKQMIKVSQLQQSPQGEEHYQSKNYAELKKSIAEIRKEN